MKLIKKNLVIKSNKLIWMQSDLNLTQLKLFAKVIIETVKNPNSEFYRFNIRELMQEFHITDTNHTALKNATAKMIKAVILKGDNENSEIQLALFTEVLYSGGLVNMYLHPKLKPYILDIEKKYTKYYFENISWLNSIYSIRIYELLKEFEFRKNRVFELDKFRFLLNISKDKYKNFPDFKKRILLSSQKELVEKTDIKFEFQEIRESRKVKKINFTIISNQKENIEVSNSSKNSLKALLKTKLFLNDTQIKTVLKQFEDDYIKRNIEYTLNQKNIKNIAWYFMKALEQDYWQTLFIQNQQKEINKNILNTNLQEEQKQIQIKKEFEKDKKAKIEEFINNREDEVIKLIPSFIKANKFLLQNYKIDLDNQNEILQIIKGKNKELNKIKILFMWFISKTVI